MNRKIKKTVQISGLSLMMLLPICSAYAQYSGNASPVGIPKFHLRDGNIQFAGKAFGIQWFHHRKLLLMPLHLLGPGAGYPVYILPQNVHEEVKSLELFDLTARSVVTTAGPALLHTGIPVEKARGDIGEDLMAFELPSNCSLPLLPLAATLVPVGTKVWVLTKGQPAATSEADRFSGTVVRSIPTGVTIAMDQPLAALSCSGSPVVNANNELVCMMVGKQDIQRMVIMGIPSTRIYAKLYRELEH